MKMDFTLEMTQKQELVMTQELRQAIQILQYNSYELNQFIDEKLTENPTLEKEEVKDEFEDVDWDQVADDSYHNRYSGGSYVNNSDEEYNYENFVSKDENLKDFLEEQLIFSNLPEKYYDLANYLIDSVDLNGYLEYDLDKIQNSFDISEEMLEEVIYYLQEFEPSGVFARNLQECLLIQLYNKKIKNHLAIDIVENYLEELSKNQLKKIAEAIEEPIEKIQEISDYIKTLEPKPGRSFSSNSDTKYIEPDIILKKEEDEYRIVLTNYTAPRLYVSKFYQKMIKAGKTKDKDKKYIKDKMNKALFIIQSIEQRRETILKVVGEIIKKQREFFDKGMLYLKPLNMKEVADEIEVHESTVSRASSGKYLQCDQGLFELKFFFQSGVKTTDGGRGIAADSIKMIIKEIVERENEKKPLSDQKITDRLAEYGINCSRRTIAKYRKALGIKSSRKRKRY